MTTVSESVRAYAAGFAYPQPRTFVVARTIREQDPTLLPRDPVGRNLSTHLQPSHLLNLILGLAVGDPIANVAALVRNQRAARWMRPPEEIFDGAKPQTAILGGQTLGLDLEGLINFLARPSAKERAMRLRYHKDFRVTLDVGEALMATVAAPVQKVGLVQVDKYDAKGKHTSAGGQTFLFQGKKREVVPLRRVVHLEFAHFELAAELWADSLKHGVVYTPSPLDSSDDEPETETAAPGPCRDRNAAAVSDQTADTVLDGASQTHPTSEREKSQLPRVKRSGRHFHPSGTTHDRKESHSTSAAFT